MKRSAWVWLFAIGGSVSAHAGLLLSQEEALKKAFPTATVERKTVFLNDAQVAEIKKRAQAPVPSRVISYYVARSSGTLVGHAYFDTHIVRTMPETFMGVVSPDGTLARVELLSFYEPEDYRPPPRWFDLFKSKKLDDNLRPKRGVRHITGATLSVHTITDGVRRLLAIHEVAVTGPP